MRTWHFSIFQIIPWNWKQLTNSKVQGKKVFWHVILLSYLCNILHKFSIKIVFFQKQTVFPKQILKLKALDQSIPARKKLFCHMIVKNYLHNVLCKFLIKIENTWRKIKERTPQLTLLHHGGTVRSSHWRCSIRKLFLKIMQYPQETPVSIFKTVADL